MSLNRICKASGEHFTVEDEDLAFYEKISPRFSGRTFPIPPPSLSPQERFRRRLAFRNERALFHRRCDLTGKQIISIFSQDSSFKVYDQEAWWSDRWDALGYGREFNFSRSFTEQFKELLLSVPHISLYTRNVENSYYTNYALNSKNCYLAFGCVDSEDCLYGSFVSKCRDVVDGLGLVDCEDCYEGIESEACYGTDFFMNCRNCSHCFLVEDCHSCSDCIMCFGLYKKQYCILNKQVSRLEYESFRSKLYPLTWQKIVELKQKLHALSLSLPHRDSVIYQSENCTGQGVFNSKNSKFCYNVSDCEDCKNLCAVTKGRSSYDGSYAAPYGPEYCYEFCSSTGSQHSLGIYLCWLCHEAFYSVECQSCKNIFGCVGLRNKEYCIFNKQYSKEEYGELAAKIAAHMTKSGEWGEFFPMSLSHFAYNHSLAQEYFPIEKDIALSKDWKWGEEKQVLTITEAAEYEVPDTIDKVSDSILNIPITCKDTQKLYKLTAKELQFYRRHKLPVPLSSPNSRHQKRLEKRAPRNLWKRSCAKTGKEIWTTFSPERPEIVYSEEAYRKEMY